MLYFWCRKGRDAGGFSMLCQRCHTNKASVRYSEVVDGKVTQLHLCKKCLDAQQESGETGFELAAPVSYTGGGKTKKSRAPEVSMPTVSCSVCETSLKSIQELGTVGCLTCYETFPAELEAILEGIHVGLTHRGKTPKVDDARSRVRAELQTKRTLLKTALNMENYEEAAALRDDIRAMESGLGLAEMGQD